MAPVRPIVSADVATLPVDDALSLFTPVGGGLGEVGNDLDKPPVVEVAELWGEVVLDVRHFAPDHGPVTIGAGADLPHGADDPRELLGWREGRVVLRVDGDAAGWIADARGHRQLRDLVASREGRPTFDGRWEIDLPPLAVVWVEIGVVSFLVREVPAGACVAGAIAQPDYPFLGVMGLFGAVLLALSAIIASAPPPTDVSLVTIPDRFAQVMLATPAPEVAPPVVERLERREAPGEKAAREEGRIGPRKGRLDRAKGSRVRMDKQRLDKEVAENSGLLGAVGESGDLASLFASGLSVDLTGGVDGLIGAKGVQMGTDGLSSRGRGFGGGGRAHRMGGSGTHGRGEGDDAYGATGGLLAPKVEGVVRSDSMIKVGEMDKSLIDGVVKRQMNAIRYCYQRELALDPDLAGKVTVRFVIASDGSVSAATIKRSSLGNSASERCMTNRFLTMQFPPVRGGGIVIVSYPFMFSAR